MKIPQFVADFIYAYNLTLELVGWFHPICFIQMYDIAVKTRI